MWLPHIVTTPPAAEPVSIEEARAQVEVAEGDDSFDTVLNTYIAAARAHAEDYTGQKLITQTVELRCSCWGDLAHLPVAPIDEVTAVKYLDTAGVEQTLSTDVYEDVMVGTQSLDPGIRAKPNQTFPAIRQVSDAIRVTATAGYGNAAALAIAKPPLKLAQLLMIADWFAHREDSNGQRLTTIPRGAETLLANHRI